MNPLARHTQFADYHGHGWNFRAILRRDREGNLLDADGQVIPPGDPDTFRREGEGLFVPVGVNPGRSVHMMDIHAERGLQCADCHFAQDATATASSMARSPTRSRSAAATATARASAYREPAHLQARPRRRTAPIWS